MGLKRHGVSSAAVTATFIFLNFVSLAALGTGCGGGSGNATQTASRVVPLASRLRTLQRGDDHQYSGTSRSARGTYTIAARVSIATTTISPTPYLQQLNALEVVPRPPAGEPVSGGGVTARYLSQNAVTGDVSLAYEGGGISGFPNLLAEIPGEWRVGISSSQTVNTGGGPSSRVTFAVVGTETVRVPRGTFETWKTVLSQTNDSFETEGTYWWAPQLGTFVKAEYTATDKVGLFAGETTRYSLELTQTNVSLPPTSP